MTIGELLNKLAGANNDSPVYIHTPYFFGEVDDVVVFTDEVIFESLTSLS